MALNKLRYLLFFTLSCLSISILAQPDTRNSKTPDTKDADTPYIKATANGAPVDNLPLLLTTVDSTITGIIADVTVTQYYKNDGELPVEAIYVFPGSVNAAVYALEMRVNDRLVIAEVNEKQQARIIYEEAKEAGKTTSLLEQTDSAFFQTNVGNILPGDDIQVSLRYVETLIPDRGLYSFRFPIIRQTTESASLPENIRSSRPVTRTGDIAFDMIIQLNAGLPIAEINSPTHQIQVERESHSNSVIVLNPDDLYNNDKDFILQYRLNGNEIQAGLLTYQGPDDNYFLLMAQPPSEVTNAHIPAREYLFVMDISGSMHGEPIEIARQAASELLLQLRDVDRFNVYLFSGGNKQLSKNTLIATPDNIDRALAFLDGSNAGGHTNLQPVLQAIIDTPLTEGVSRSTIVITDGGIAAGIDTLQLIRDNLHSQNLFSFGVGNFQNQAIIDGLANSGRGQSFSVSNTNDADVVVDNLLRYISQPVLTDITIDYPSGLEVYDVIPESIPDVFSERPVYVVGKWNGSWNSAVTIQGVSGNGIYSTSYLPEYTGANENTSAIRLLWAREQLRDWEDDERFQTGIHQDQITQLGLDYSLVTQYTSFVAVDYEVRRDPEQDNEEVVLAAAPPPSQSPRQLSGFGIAAKSLQGSMNLTTPALPAQSLLAIERVDNPPVIDANNSASVTFIMGQDEDINNPFYRAALEYFEHHKQESDSPVVTHLRTLEDVRQWLADNHNGIDGWKKINIVTHGSAWTGLGVPVSDADIETGSFPLELSFDPQHALTDTLINEQTDIRLYGCGLGQSPRLLNQVSEFFGGTDAQRPAVYSPSAPLAFHADFSNPLQPSVDYSLLHSWSLVGDTQSPWSSTQLAKQLQRQFGSQHNWTELLNSPGIYLRHDPITFEIKIPGLTRLPDNIPAWRLASRQTLLSRYMHETGMAVGDLDWQYRTDNGIISVVGKGWLYQLIAPQLGDSDDGSFVVVKPMNTERTRGYARH